MCGGGKSAEDYYKEMKIDYIKIDGSLVRDICIDEIDCAMVESIHSMAHLLDIQTIAESVDNDAAIEKLKSIGIDYAQGYYLGDLVRLDEISSNIRERGISETQVN